MERSPKAIGSVDSLRRRMRAIVESLNADPALALRASANPILALEELGYSLTDTFRVEAELRARFDEDGAKRMQDLRARVLAAVGAGVDLDSARSVTQAVRRLGVELERPSKRGRVPSPAPFPASDSRSLLPALRARVDDHPVVMMLVDYLELDAGRPRLADRATYERLRERPPDPDLKILVRFSLARENRSS